MATMMKHRLGAAAMVGLGLLAAMPAWAASGARTTSFAYDPASGLLTQEVIEPGNAAFRLQSTYGHDAYGNKVSVTVSGADIASRTSIASFDSRGRFMTGTSNELGHGESFQMDARFGGVLSRTDANALTTSSQYDDLGRKVLEIRPDGTRTKWDYVFCSGVAGGTATCPALGAYMVTETRLATDGATQNGPQSKIYYDRLDRQIAKDTEGFDGGAIRSAQQYDALGRIKQVSRPYFLSGGPPRWTLREYDVASRLTKETAPDGAITTIAYDALVTVTTNALGQTHRVVKNARNLVVGVTDSAGQNTLYSHDAFGNLTGVTDPLGNVTAMSYDTRGRKVAMTDPDLGAWSYSYDVLGRLLSQTDAKGQTTSMVYDKLGRMLSRTDGDGTATWTYDTAAHGIGKLAATLTSGGVGRALTYDALGRAAQSSTSVDGATYSESQSYDAHGRSEIRTYPSGLAVKNIYTSRGDLQQVVNATTGASYWLANALDAELRVTAETSGNGVATAHTFDPDTGLLRQVQSGSAGNVANLGFVFDQAGNLTRREDTSASVVETFGYDSLNRLTNATIAGGTAKTLSYDAIGNITAKSDVGSYAYPAVGQSRPHAVSAITGAVSAAYTYDANGNLLSGGGRTIVWTASNHPASIAQGAVSLSFTYDADRRRVKKVSASGTQLYIGTGTPSEHLSGAGGVVTWTDYIMAGGQVVGQRVSRSDGQSSVRYYVRDHLGSIAVIADETGQVAERPSYDPWGRRRQPNGADDPAGALTSQASRGFTGHEMLDDVDLVHMNGRVYDPQIGRFVSADPLVPDAFSSQSFNRYSYVRNRPLSVTDPTGYTDGAMVLGPVTVEGSLGGSWGGFNGGYGGWGWISSWSSSFPSFNFNYSAIGAMSFQAPTPAMANNSGMVLEPITVTAPLNPEKNKGDGADSDDDAEAGGAGYARGTDALSYAGGNGDSAKNAGDGVGQLTTWYFKNSYEAVQDGISNSYRSFSSNPWGYAESVLNSFPQTRLEGAGFAGAAGIIKWGKNISISGSEGVSFTRSQLQHAFKHADDFGVMGNANNTTLSEFASAIKDHMGSSGTRIISGTYHGNTVTHFVNPATGLNVIRDASGNFVSGWKLSPEQLGHVLNGGKLGGGS